MISVAPMRPFAAPMEVESSRSYVDEIYSADAQRCLDALVALKNSVIGSDRAKGSVIRSGVAPRLLQLIADPRAEYALRLEAAIAVGSLAKGTAEHVARLVDEGAVAALVDALRPAPPDDGGDGGEGDERLAEACLRALRSIVAHPPAPAAYADAQLLHRLLGVARHGTPVAKACVARLLSVWCAGRREQDALHAAGAFDVAASLLAQASPPSPLTLPTLDWLAAMCFENAAAARAAMEARADSPSSSSCRRGVPALLAALLSRDKPAAVAMGAARCVAFAHRAGALAADDRGVVFGALPCLARLCAEDAPDDIRATAAETLAYLAEVDASLQRLAAISNRLVAALAELVARPSAAAKQGAFKCFASLGANDEDIRKRIIEIDGLMAQVVDGMAHAEPEVRLAAVRCLHSLSRSVQQLRTTFQDHSVWRPLMSLLNESPGAELLTVGSSTLCNLLLEFSPAKEPMLEQGAVEMLCGLTRRTEQALRLNGIWALMNMAFQAEQRVKTRILSCLGTEQMFKLLGDPDTRIIMKTLGLLRNLLSTRQHIDTIMSDYSSQVMQAVIVVLEGDYPAEVKEQALCILGNIGDGERAKDYIMANEDVLRKLVDYLLHPESKLQEAALFAIGNLVWRGEPGAAERQARLVELGALSLLRQLLPTTDAALLDKVKTALSQFGESD